MEEVTFQIVSEDDAGAVSTARSIFREYEAWLGLDLCFQGFESELATLPGKYALPDGRLFLAFRGSNIAGCVALRKLDEKTCEMKRLFVRPAHQGLGLGVTLLRMVIAAARDIGYKRLRLDTYPPKMGKAVGIYEAHGFRQIGPYYDNPNPETLFMELDLAAYIPLP